MSPVQLLSAREDFAGEQAETVQCPEAEDTPGHYSWTLLDTPNVSWGYSWTLLMSPQIRGTSGVLLGRGAPAPAAARIPATTSQQEIVFGANVWISEYLLLLLVLVSGR